LFYTLTMSITPIIETTTSIKGSKYIIIKLKWLRNRIEKTDASEPLNPPRNL